MSSLRSKSIESVQGKRVLEECDDILIDIASTEGDIFLSPEINEFIDMSEDDRSMLDVSYVETIHKKLLYIKDEFEFAVILKSVLIALLGLIYLTIRKKDDSWTVIKNRIESSFYIKNKAFIDQLWYWIVYYNLWYSIQFITNILLAFQLS